MSDAPRVTYVPDANATPEGEAQTLAAVYRFILRNHMEQSLRNHAPSEEVKDVKQRPDKPSEIAVTNSRK
jgi:hypothetical protein